MISNTSCVNFQAHPETEEKGDAKDETNSHTQLLEENTFSAHQLEREYSGPIAEEGTATAVVY